jgi:hypothetical protein
MIMGSGATKTSADLAVGGGFQTFRFLKFVMAPFGVHLSYEV